MNDTLAQPNPVARAAAGKYLTFKLATESYGVAVLNIREIIRLTAITAVPQVPDHVKGVINLRGKIIPVTDLGQRFGADAISATEQTCIIVVQICHPDDRTSQMGLIVDGVEDVVTLAATDIEETPDFGATLAATYILGLAKIKGVVKTLLDIDKVVCPAAVR